MTPKPVTAKTPIASKILPRLIISLALTFITFIAAMPNTAHAIEEPAYTVIQKTDVFEVRQYAPYLVAEVIVPGPANEAGSQGFSLLGGYIFGKNKGERKLEMTAPVTQTPLESNPPVKLEMTAPVTQAPAPGGFSVQFVMPKGYTLATLPEPVDAKVKLREVLGQRVAVIRFSGGWSQTPLKRSCKHCALRWQPLASRHRASPCRHATTALFRCRFCGAMKSGCIWFEILSAAEAACCYTFSSSYRPNLLGCIQFRQVRHLKLKVLALFNLTEPGSAPASV